MGKQHRNKLSAAVRRGGRAIVALGRPTLVGDIAVGIASWIVPPGESRRKLARKFNCKASIVPEVLLYYTAIYTLVGLNVLLLLWGLILTCSG